MALTDGVHASAASNGSASLATASRSVSAGSGLYAGLALTDGVHTFTSLTDTSSNEWVLIGAEQVAASYSRQRTYYCAKVTGADAAYVLTLASSAAGPCSLWFKEIKASNANGITLGTQNQQMDNLTPFLSPSIAVNINEMMMALDMETECSGTLNHAESTGFTVSSGDDVTDGDTLWPGQSASLVASSTTNFNTSWTVSGGGASWNPRLWIAAFSEAAAAGAAAALTGTATASITEADIVTGGKTIIATLTDDTYVSDTPVTPLIEAADCTVSGSNTAAATWAVSHPAAATGDLLIFNIAWDDSVSTTDVAEPSGVNGETLTEINATPVTDGLTETRSKAWYCKATGAWTASTRTFTPTATESWSATVIKVLAGEFDPTTPIGAIGTANDTTGTDTTVDSPAYTAGSSDGNGRLIWFAGVDTDPLGGTNPTGWTIRQAQDLGAVAHGIATRDAAVTNSESIASATWDIAGDSWTSIAYIVRAPASAFAAARQAFINGFDSAQSEGTGWDAEVKAKAAVTQVVRTSSTVVTWTIGAQAGYNITATETITGIIPASILSGASPITATPTIAITASGGATVVNTGDSIRLGLTEDRAILPRLTREDTIQLGLTEDRTILARLTREDILGLILTDLSAIATVINSAGDSIRIVVVEQSQTIQALVNRGDALAVGLSEDRSTLALLIRDESIALALQDSSRVLAMLTREETLAMILSELSFLATNISSADTQGLGLTDAMFSLRALVNRDDAIAVGLADALLALSATLSTTDTLVIGLAEDRVILARVNREDSLALGLTESSLLSALLQRDDTIGVQPIESSAILARLVREDTFSIVLIDSSSIVDLGGNLVTLSSSDLLPVRFVEDALPIFARLNRDESVAIGLSDISQILTRLTREDLVPLRMTENSSFAVMISSAGDVLTLGLAEDAHPTTIIIGADAVLTGIQELSNILARVASDDATHVGLAEISQAILARLTRDDISACMIVDNASLLSRVTTDEVIALRMTESGFAIQVALGILGAVLIATVRQLGGVRTIMLMRSRSVQYLGPVLSVELT